MNGVPLNMLQKWMGHAQLSTTAIYADAIGKEEQDIAARMWRSDHASDENAPGCQSRAVLPDGNRARALGDWGLVREWGRIGSPGQVRTDWFGSEAEAKDARFTLHMRKAKRGYE